MRFSKYMVACAVTLWSLNAYGVTIAGVDVDESNYGTVIKVMPEALKTLEPTLKTLATERLPEAIAFLEQNPQAPKRDALLTQLKSIEAQLPDLPKVLTEYAVKFDQKMFDSEEMSNGFAARPEFFPSYFPTPELEFLFTGKLDKNYPDPKIRALFIEIDDGLREPFLEALKKING